MDDQLDAPAALYAAQLITLLIVQEARRASWLVRERWQKKHLGFCPQSNPGVPAHHRASV